MGKKLHKRPHSLGLASFFIHSVLVLGACSAWAASPPTTGSSEFALLPLACGTEANRTCDQAIQRVTFLIEERVRQQVIPSGSTQGLYRLKDLLQVPKPGIDSDNNEIELETSHANFPEICSLNGNRFNGSATEKDSNHLGRSCGQPDTIECRTSTKGEIRAQLVTGTGTREKAHLNGVFLEALDCVSREIKEEITQSRELKLPGTETTNPCQSFNAFYSEAKLKLQQESQKASAESRTLCKFTSDGLPEQARCYANAAIESLDSLFAAVAVCEAFRRSNVAFSAFSDATFSPTSRQKWWRDLSTSCATGPSSNSCGAFSSCYHEKYRSMIGTESRSWFPSSGRCRLQ